MIRAVLFDRDGTLVRDVPYNGDPRLVDPMPGARAVLDRLRRAGLAVGVVTNQSGVARGLLTVEDVESVNRRVEALLGPFNAWAVCYHGPGEGCECRKPAPGLVHEAARKLGVRPEECALVGDIGADVAAALAAGARPVLIPTPVTRPEEVAEAPEVAADLFEAANLLLSREQAPAVGRHVLVARLDSLGDVLLAGPAVRAVAAGAGRVTLLCGPRGRAAAELLPGVHEVICFSAPWIDPDPQPVSAAVVQDLVEQVLAAGVDEAVILTSFHQSPLPLALLLRLAYVPTIAAISEDYPGSLLDVRHRVPDDLHEVERSLSLVGTLGYRLPRHDDGRLSVLRPRVERWAGPLGEGYVVVHPGASVPARAWSPDRNRELVARLSRLRPVVVTGSAAERELTAFVAGESDVVDAGGRLSFAQLADVLVRADAVVTGNTGPAHLAAAVSTPVVSLFAPTVPAARWRPWGVPHVLLGQQDIGCAGCRARTCPIAGHPCIGDVTVAEVLEAVQAVAKGAPPSVPSEVLV